MRRWQLLTKPRAGTKGCGNAALIKARPCAGDPATGAAFLRAIAPFIWRRRLWISAGHRGHPIDQAAEFTPMKVMARSRWPATQYQSWGAGTVSAKIEFFAQTQQLILGGRTVCDLRAPATALPRWRVPTARGGDQPSRRGGGNGRRPIRFLRGLEHRLQMSAGRADPYHIPGFGRKGLRRISPVSGSYATADDFAAP